MENWSVQWVFALFIIELCVICFGFNVDVVHPVIYRGPSTDPRGFQTRADTYFGYSVGLSSGGEGGVPYVLIGAPRANSTLGVFPPSEILEPGALYKCPFRRGVLCEEVFVDRTGNQPAPGFEYTDLKDQGWLGGTMDVENKGKGRLAVSGFRWRNTKYRNHYLGNGVCYLSDANVNDDQFTKLVPLYETNKQSFTQGRSTHVYFYSYGQAGTSIHFPDNGRELVMGAPGVFDWTGTLIRYRDIDETGGGGGNNRRRRRRQLELESIVVPNPYTTKLLARYDYLGYSVGSGKFFNSDDSTLYVTGAPRAAAGRGKVYLLDFPRNEYEPYDILFEREGESVGDYFGASVLAVDLTGDGLSEIVVGAPFHGTAENPEMGQAVVFLNGDNGIFQPTPRPLTGSGAAWARFGSALARLGDLDRDGVEDMAVGAPYEDGGRGAIYIYRGGLDFTTTPSQRITGRDISDVIRGFGISISRGLDVDANRYIDFVVGSYSSGDAVLLRSKPVIQFVSTLTASPDKLETDATKFELHACLGYRGSFVPSGVNANVTVKVESYHAQSRLIVQDTDRASVNFPWRLMRDRNLCRTFLVAIRSPGRIDYTKPIQLSMRYSLSEAGSTEPGSRPVIIDTRTDKRSYRPSRKRRQSASIDDLNDFCTSCPVSNINMDNQQQIRLNVPFSVGCGSDGVCDTDLKLRYKFPKVKNNEYVIGSTSQLALELSLTNNGEPASLPTLSIEIGAPLTLVRVPPTCEEKGSENGRAVLTCNVLPHPFYSDSKYTMRLMLDTADVTAAVKALKFNVSVTSTGLETQPTDNILNITLPLVSQADMEILGSPLLEHIFYDKEEDRQSDKKGTPNYLRVEHSYQILKYLPTPVKAVAISFIIPVNFTTGGSSINFIQLYPPAASISGQPLSCSLQGTTDFIRSTVESNHDASDAETISLVEDRSKPQQEVHRRRRDANAIPSRSTPVANGTYILNCTRGSAVRCVRMTCPTVSFLTESARASVTLDMRVDMHVLEPLLGGRDQVSIVTQGFVQILDSTSLSPDINRRPDIATVATALLPAKLRPDEVAWWIILLAVLGALFLLAGIVYLLYRLGFFKRSKHEQLLEEQKDAEIEENFGKQEPQETDKLKSGED